MAAREIEERRQAWREAYDAKLPLAAQLDWPYTPAWQIAHVMGVSESTVYASGKRFDDAMRREDRAAAARDVPCVLMGHSHRFPSAAFIAWWESAGAITMDRLTCAESSRVGAT